MVDNGVRLIEDYGSGIDNKKDNNNKGNNKEDQDKCT